MLLGAEFHAPNSKERVVSPLLSGNNTSIRMECLKHFPADIARLIHSYATFVRGDFVKSLTLDLLDDFMHVAVGAFSDKIYTLQIVPDTKLHTRDARCFLTVASLRDPLSSSCSHIDLQLPSFHDELVWWKIDYPIFDFSWYLDVSDQYILIWALHDRLAPVFWFKVLDRHKFDRLCVSALSDDQCDEVMVVKNWFRHDFGDGDEIPVSAQLVHNEVVLLTGKEVHRIPIGDQKQAAAEDNVKFLNLVQEGLRENFKGDVIEAHLDVEHRHVVFTLPNAMNTCKAIGNNTVFRSSACVAKACGDQLAILFNDIVSACDAHSLPSAVILNSRSSTRFKQILQPPASADDAEWNPRSFSFVQVDGVVMLLVFSRDGVFKKVHVFQ